MFVIMWMMRQPGGEGNVEVGTGQGGRGSQYSGGTSRALGRPGAERMQQRFVRGAPGGDTEPRRGGARGLAIVGVQG